MRLREAAVWFQRGRGLLEAGQAADAVEALRRATAIDPDQRAYRLALANALVVATQVDAARQVLRDLRERTPDDPAINTSLARLEVRRDDVAAAVRYYENALYGAWPADQDVARRELRMELIRYLLAHGDKGRALSQLFVLAANLPDDVPLEIQTAELFMAAGDARRALERFRHVLRSDSDNAAALAGAGEAAFDLADYGRARRYLQAVPRPTERTRELADLAELVIANDPLAPRLANEARRRRALAGLARARARLEGCALQGSAAGGAPHDAWPSSMEAASLAHALETTRGRETPDALERAVDLVARMEDAADAAGCAATDLDRALSLIARRHAGDAP
jgi:predicted Zn-dependent protease